ncbi:MAG: hypothetical protein ACE5DI_00335 [Candidatus Micrarchaeia archaeon]
MGVLNVFSNRTLISVLFYLSSLVFSLKFFYSSFVTSAAALALTLAFIGYALSLTLLGKRSAEEGKSLKDAVVLGVSESAKDYFFVGLLYVLVVVSAQFFAPGFFVDNALSFAFVYFVFFTVFFALFGAFLAGAGAFFAKNKRS